MPPRDPTKNQYSKGLGYSAHTPAFLVQLQQRVAGTSGREESFDSIDGRPAIPTRPEGEDSGDEEDADEKPQVVVLKEGKHLSARDLENEKRKGRGLAPLPQDEDTPTEASEPGLSTSSSSKEKQSENQSLSFSSKGGSGKPQKKRKAIDTEGEVEQPNSTTRVRSDKTKKKAKKESKTLLSFGDGGD